jgi:hypothetical protein
MLILETIYIYEHSSFGEPRMNGASRSCFVKAVWPARGLVPKYLVT